MVILDHGSSVHRGVDAASKYEAPGYRKEIRMKRTARIVGVLFLVAGIAGFIPALCPDGMLFGIFAVNAMHNLVHIASGILALAMAFSTGATARAYFRIVAAVYTLLAVVGFVAGRDGLLMGMAMNMADNVLDLALAVVFLYLGFVWNRELPPQHHGPAAA